MCGPPEVKCSRCSTSFYCRRVSIWGNISATWNCVLVILMSSNLLTVKSIVYNICNIFVQNIFLSWANLPHVSRRRSPLCYLVKFSPRGDRSTGAPKLLSRLDFGSFLTFSLSSSFHNFSCLMSMAKETPAHYHCKIDNDRVIENKGRLEIVWKFIRFGTLTRPSRKWGEKRGGFCLF